MYHPIYTVGHGTRKAVEFVDLLKYYGILYLIDVRSQPYSKFNPHFNQHDLRFLLENNGVNYVFMGDSLGGRPSDRDCYNNEGKVDYEIVKTKEFFISGINRLLKAIEKNISLGVMCSESKPGDCHRSKLIGRILSDEKIAVKHIDEKGRIKTQADVINEQNKGRSDDSLFPGQIDNYRTSRKSYI